MADTIDFPEPDRVNVTLGFRIRAQRIRHKMKISDLADLTGLTSSTISQVERALISPSIATLKKICDAMNIPISYLFEDINDADQEYQEEQNGVNLAQLKTFSSVNLMGLSPVVHKEERKFLSPGPGIRFYLLNPNLAGPSELIYNEYDPGAGTGPALYSHPGSECGLILSGELVVQIRDDLYTLKAGDSITFNSSEPHLKKNISDVMCTCIWANTPPWF
ncbi:MAG: cupin domain-containing protein [Spirochaetaceae bacterium]|jgi:transcriptional regulator with XRE-family HTH domain|nr:cupin domain-containing protein [Spirochaetaceae bacterium]